MMICPHCSAEADDVTNTWHTFEEAAGAEYLATYVTIWRCPECSSLIGAQNDQTEWVIEPREAMSEQ